MEEHCSAPLYYQLAVLCPSAGTSVRGGDGLWEHLVSRCGGEASTPDSLSPSLCCLFGSGFGFSSSVMVFSLISLMQSTLGHSCRSRGGEAPHAAGAVQVLAAWADLWGSPQANAGALLREEKQSFCSSGTCFEHPPITLSPGTNWDGGPQGMQAPPCHAAASPKAPFLAVVHQAP